jgi:hypothetical protein
MANDPFESNETPGDFRGYKTINPGYLGPWKEFEKEKPEVPGVYLMYDADIGIGSICYMQWAGKIWHAPRPDWGGRTMVTHWMDIAQPTVDALIQVNQTLANQIEYLQEQIRFAPKD